MTNKNMEMTINPIESLTMNQNLVGFFLIIAADTNPPAIAPIKYAPISKVPWGMNVNMAKGFP